jgi:hypothetical protein
MQWNWLNQYIKKWFSHRLAKRRLKGNLKYKTEIKFSLNTHLPTHKCSAWFPFTCPTHPHSHATSAERNRGKEEFLGQKSGEGNRSYCKSRY